MKTLFDPTDYKEMLDRLERLRPDSPRAWGTMAPAQMLAHLVAALETATGDLKLKRMFIGRILGPLAKNAFIGPRPFKPGNPTAKEFTISDTRDFATEKQRLLAILKRFHEGGEKAATTHPHSFFGHLTQKQWGETQWKHLDHHFRQFGV